MRASDIMDLANLSLNDLLSTLGVWGMTYIVALWIALIYWAYRDAQARIKRPLVQILASLLVVAFFIPGILIYLVVRPTSTLEERYLQTLQEESLLRSIEAHELSADPK